MRRAQLFHFICFPDEFPYEPVFSLPTGHSLPSYPLMWKEDKKNVDHIVYVVNYHRTNPEKVMNIYRT